VVKLGDAPSQHAWYGTKLRLQSPFDLERLTNTLNEAVDKIAALSAQLTKIYSSIVGDGTPCFADSFALVQAFRHLLTVPEFRSALVSPVWTGELEELLKAIDQGERFGFVAAEINGLFEQQAWSFDTKTVLFSFARDGQSLFGRFSRRYRQALTDLRGICRQRLPRRLADRVALVQKLADAQDARRDSAALSAYLQAALGPIWAGTETKWPAARALAAWTRAALSEIGGRQIITLAARVTDLSAYATVAEPAGIWCKPKKSPKRSRNR
jgi:hypothetical protein